MNINNLSQNKSWTKGNNPERPIDNIFVEMSAIEGEISDEEAKATLAKFLYHNPAFMFDLLGGMKLFPMQELIIKGWARNEYNLAIWGRGMGKSFLVAVFALYWAMFNPGVRVIIASFSFKQSRQILSICAKLINENDAALLRSAFPIDVRRGTDEYVLEVPNGAVIRCLPLGDGKKIRGFRADLLIIDEFAFLPENIIGEILRPFLASNSRIKEQRAIDERETDLIARGLMSADQRTILEDRKKVIFLSSACYQFEHLYKRYLDWIDLLTNPLKMEELQEGGVSYFISRLSWEAAPPGLLNLREIEQARRESSESMFNREYGAQFTSDSGGYFKMSKMIECSIKDGELPVLELYGEKNAEYIVSIDVALSGAEDADHFAICVLKLITKVDGRRIPMLVHSYAVAGGDLKDHILYFYYVLTRFNVVYIAIDASQGDNVEFLNSSVQSKLFKDARIDLCDIEADLKHDRFNEMPIEIKLSYNRAIGRIVHKQAFSSAWQRAANEWMQACFDHHNMLFAGKIAANSTAAGIASQADMSLLNAHGDFKDMGVSLFIELQDNLVDMTRTECAMIVVDTTPTGHLQFKLPQNVRRSGGPNRARKDSYSALLLGIWAARMYLESQSIHIETGPSEFPYILIG